MPPHATRHTPHATSLSFSALSSQTTQERNRDDRKECCAVLRAACCVLRAACTRTHVEFLHSPRGRLRVIPDLNVRDDHRAAELQTQPVRPTAHIRVEPHVRILPGVTRAVEKLLKRTLVTLQHSTPQHSTPHRSTPHRIPHHTPHHTTHHTAPHAVKP
jgi:hypothetical protein